MEKLERMLPLKLSKPKAYYCCECGNVRVIRELSILNNGKKGHYCFRCDAWREYESLESTLKVE